MTSRPRILGAAAAALAVLAILVPQLTATPATVAASPAPQAALPVPPIVSFTEWQFGFRQPTGVSVSSDGSRVYVVEQLGTVRLIKNGSLQPGVFLDIKSQVLGCDGAYCEIGLYSIAFPKGVNDRFYITFASQAYEGDNVLARMRTMPGNPDKADPSSLEILLVANNPDFRYYIHNGGQLAFGPNDGFLYWGVGDGDGQEADNKHAQNSQLLLGKILRLDVECCVGQSPGYRVPATNPFVGNTAFRPEIWAWGLRNPWRFSFDPSNGDLFISDVGRFQQEEIDFQSGLSSGGENYGWPWLEGEVCFADPQCNPNAFVKPIWVRSHDDGACSVTGGFVARGPKAGALEGWYLFADFCGGTVHMLRRQPDCGWQAADADSIELQFSTFGMSPEGELFAAEHTSGTLYRVESFVAQSTAFRNLRRLAGAFRLGIPFAYGPPLTSKPDCTQTAALRSGRGR